MIRSKRLLHLMLSMFLTVGSSLALAGLNCKAVFATQIFEHRVVSTPTEFGVDVYLNRKPTLGTQTKFSQVKTSQIKVGNYFPPYGESYNVVIKNINGAFVEARAPLNDRFFRMEDTVDGIMFTEIKRPSVFPLSPHLNLEPQRSFKMEQYSSQELISLLLESQQQSSGTLRYENPEDHTVKNLKDAITFSLSKKSFSINDLEKINEIINIGSDPQKLFYWPDDVLNFGTIRGTEPKVILRRIKYFEPSSEKPRPFLIDLSQAEMKNQEGFEVYYMPAAKVKGAVTQWLREFNNVNGSSPLRDILKLYQKFIIIHPFIEGNGRTSRILLDLMLMRAGFAPITSQQHKIRDVLYHSIDDLQAILIKEQP